MVRVAVGDEDGVQLVHAQGAELVHQPVPGLKGARVHHDPFSRGEGQQTGVPLAHGQEEQVHLVRLDDAMIQGCRVRGSPGLTTAEEQQEGYEDKSKESFHGSTTSKTFTTPFST